MAPPPHLLVPDSSVKALISQCKSSSSPTSSVDSPTTEPSLTVSSPSEHAAHHRSLPLDITLPSSSSSSCSMVPEILPIPTLEGPQQRRKKKQKSADKKNKHNTHMDPPGEERHKQVKQPRVSADFEKKSKGCQDNVCCKCAAGFTADCAAVCCCPLALLHLAALTFIRLPTAIAWKMLVKLKNRMYKNRCPTKDDEDDSPRPKFNNPWSYGSSPEGTIDMGAHTAGFDSQNLWQHFDSGRLDFGGLSMRRDPQ